MANVRILTDSTGDVPEDIAQRLKIAVVPAYVQFQDKSLRDKEQISRSAFYDMLPNLAEVPTTAVPPSEEFAAAFRDLARQTDQLVAILLSANLSGMLNAARLGSLDVEGAEIHLVDSGQVAMGLGWEVILAAEAAAEGRSVQEILALIEEVKPRIRILAMLDTVEYLRRGGRVAWASYITAHLLHIKPLLEVRQGEVTLVGKIRTRRKAMERLVEMTADLGPLDRLAVLHTNTPDIAVFRTQLDSVFCTEQILVSEVGPVVGAHIGPDALGIAAVTAA